MTILDSFKKLAKAWGIEPKGDNIADAVNNVVENIPFGVKTEIVEIVPEQTHQSESLMGQSGFVANGLSGVTVRDGQEVYVVFDGVQYISSAFTMDGIIVVGNGYVGDKTCPNPGEPYLMAFNIPDSDNPGDVVVFTEDKNRNEHTIKVSTEQEVVKQLDPKFVGGGFVVTMLSEDGQNFTCDRTVDEIAKAVGNGQTISINISAAGMSIPFMSPTVAIKYNGGTEISEIYMLCTVITIGSTAAIVSQGFILSADGSVMSQINELM